MQRPLFVPGGKYGNRLLFASVLINTTMVLAKTGYKEGLRVHDHWEDFVEDKVRPNDTGRSLTQNK